MRSGYALAPRVLVLFCLVRAVVVLSRVKLKKERKKILDENTSVAMLYLSSIREEQM